MSADAVSHICMNGSIPFLTGEEEVMLQSV